MSWVMTKEDYDLIGDAVKDICASIGDNDGLRQSTADSLLIAVNGTRSHYKNVQRNIRENTTISLGSALYHADEQRKRAIRVVALGIVTIMASRQDDARIRAMLRPCLDNERGKQTPAETAIECAVTQKEPVPVLLPPKHINTPYRCRFRAKKGDTEISDDTWYLSGNEFITALCKATGIGATCTGRSGHTVNTNCYIKNELAKHSHQTETGTVCMCIDGWSVDIERKYVGYSFAKA